MGSWTEYSLVESMNINYLLLIKTKSSDQYIFPKMISALLVRGTLSHDFLQLRLFHLAFIFQLATPWIAKTPTTPPWWSRHLSIKLGSLIFNCGPLAAVARLSLLCIEQTGPAPACLSTTLVTHQIYEVFISSIWVIDILLWILAGLLWKLELEENKLGLSWAKLRLKLAKVELILMLSSIEAIFHLFKIVSDSTRIDQQMFCWFKAYKVIFNWSPFPLISSSNEFVFHWDRLPLR